jgi:hypothetical protein
MDQLRHFLFWKPKARKQGTKSAASYNLMSEKRRGAEINRHYGDQTRRAGARSQGARADHPRNGIDRARTAHGKLKAQIAEQLAAEQPGNDRAQQAARDARARANETKSAAGERAETAPRAFEASPEMKRLYRTVAKRIHPDLTSDREDRAKRQLLMSQANEAYERGDEMQLAKILTEYEHSPEAVQGEGPGAELVRVIRRISQMRGRLAEMEAELQELLRSDLFQLKSRLDEAQQFGRDVLQEMVAKVDEQIEQARLRLAKPKAGGY